MRPARLLRPIPHSERAWSRCPILAKGFSLIARQNSCHALSATRLLHAQHEPKRKSIHCREKTSNRHEEVNSQGGTGPRPDHRTIGTAQDLFTTHPSSPGAPLFQPDGTHIFNKLAAFLRAQYPIYGFREVLTPTMFKQSLWEQSGHWANYKDDMFTVTGSSSYKPEAAAVEDSERRMPLTKPVNEAAEREDFGLKPMNCPGHCLLFQSQRRSYKDLPLRYADFSPLHRNEISGALSGLTRVRRFHQDDGHIFCRPSQVKNEISQSLKFVRSAYQTLGLEDYALVLSTRPRENYIGTVEDWSTAEDQLREVLKASGKPWRTNAGDGAFYGPKIDVILQDSDGKRHQTATIQLDFQLPKRFSLGYEAPAPELEAKGEPTSDPVLRMTMGIVTPIMIHRAVLGSLERFIAILLEHHHGHLPFWLSPRQVIILTVTNNTPVLEYAKNVQQALSGTASRDDLPRPIDHPSYLVDVDGGGDSIAQKIVRARKKMYNFICVVGQRNFAGVKMEKGQPTLELEVTHQPNLKKIWDAIELIKPGSQAPLQKDKGAGPTFRRMGPGVRLTVNEFVKLVRTLDKQYL